MTLNFSPAAKWSRMLYRTKQSLMVKRGVSVSPCPSSSPGWDLDAWGRALPGPGR